MKKETRRREFPDGRRAWTEEEHQAVQRRAYDVALSIRELLVNFEERYPAVEYEAFALLAAAYADAGCDDRAEREARMEIASELLTAFEKALLENTLMDVLYFVALLFQNMASNTFACDPEHYRPLIREETRKIHAERREGRVQ